MACALAVVLLLSLSAPAQTAALIGLRMSAWEDKEGSHPASYRTFLITFTAAKAHLAVEIPDLILPRKDGFWRAGTLHKGPLDVGYQEFIYVSSVQSTPHALGTYHPANPRNEGCDPTDEATIEFASPDLLSVAYTHEDCGSLEIQNRRATYNLDDPDRPLDIKSQLGGGAWLALQRADASAKASKGRLADCPGMNPVSSTNWGIERSNQLPQSSHKAWVLVGDFFSPHVCNGGDTYEIKFPIRESLIGKQYGASKLVPLSKTAAAEYRFDPNDAALTPAGNFLVAFNPPYGPITIFQVSGQALRAAPVLSVPVISDKESNPLMKWECNVVMLQWAVGKYVKQWESELKKIAATPLREPTLAVGAQLD